MDIGILFSSVKPWRISHAFPTLSLLIYL
ncbi:hypothetical protein OIU76_013231 [Salix suchowensis]|nr:hypothetical protein OIU76_013231 [Salix suchowensis]